MLEKFNELKRYSLTNDLYLKFLDLENKNFNKKEDIINKTNHVQNKTNLENNKKVNERYITPTQKDKLFWCFYILHHSYDDYKIIQNNHFTIEKDFKIDFVEIIRKNKSLLKQYGLKKNDVENQLINDREISLNLFFLLCIYHDINIMFINNNFYYDLESCGNKYNVLTVHKGSYCIDTETDNVLFYKLNYCKMDNLNRYIKPLSAYKVADLCDICLKLNINFNDNNNKRKSKNELYQEIQLSLQ